MISIDRIRELLCLAENLRDEFEHDLREFSNYGPTAEVSAARDAAAACCKSIRSLLHRTEAALLLQLHEDSNGKRTATEEACIAA